jgi:hypothetical protein
MPEDTLTDVPTSPPPVSTLDADGWYRLGAGAPRDRRQLRTFLEQDGLHRYPGHARFVPWMVMMAGTLAT